MTGDEAGELRAIVRAAVERRIGLRARVGPQGALRWFDGRVEGSPGLLAESFGPSILLRHSDAAVARLVAEGIAAVHPYTECWLRPWSGDGEERWEVDAQGRWMPWSGPADERGGERIIEEEGQRALVELGRGWNTGLFLDARAVRRWLRTKAQGLRVLNLFSFTGSLSVAAMLGGARSVTNVDVVRTTHARAKTNHALNGVTLDNRSFVDDDAFEFLRRAKGRGARWDLVVLDPPPRKTAGGRGAGFDPDRHWSKLLRAAAAVAEPWGQLLILWAGSPGGGPEPHFDKGRCVEITTDEDAPHALSSWLAPPAAVPPVGENDAAAPRASDGTGAA